jgi:hypothetical protein
MACLSSVVLEEVHKDAYVTNQISRRGSVHLRGENRKWAQEINHRPRFWIMIDKQKFVPGQPNYSSSQTEPPFLSICCSMY